MNTHKTLASKFGNLRLFAATAKFALLFVVAAAALQSYALNLTPLPPYLTESKGAPMVMFNLSKDHQLFFKAYNEYSDLDGDGVIETQYKHSYKYYGYFDNQRCYTYQSNVFVPVGLEDAAGYCNAPGNSNQWSGNFLNWGSATRADVVRRILYGGMRSTDNAAVSGSTQTVLERAHLPTDAHAFAKHYIGADVNKLTPFAVPELTMCNASFSNTAAPSILVANGNHALWSSNERWQCYWSEDKGASNQNNPALTGLAASSSNPSRATLGLGTGFAQGSYTARIEVCKPGLPGGFTADENGRCKQYPQGNFKPVGLLQKYGERNEAAFGLMTGSFDKNISGGVLRKNVSTFTDEVNLITGQFIVPPAGQNGIVSSINKLRITGYNYGDGTYLGDGASCNFQSIGLTDGECASWGNPVGEVYLESLRYLAGKQPTSAFVTATPTKDASIGLTVATWQDPFASSTTARFGERACRKSNVINFNASVISFDSNQWSSSSDISGLNAGLVDSYTNSIGAAEGLYAPGKLWSVGRNGVNNDGFCSDKAITASGTTAFSAVTGICAEGPTQFGSYKMAGAALYAHTNRIRSDIPVSAKNTRAFKVDTYSVALATGTPRIKVPVPGTTDKFVFISPSYRLDKGGGGGGTLVDFKVITQTPSYGKYVVNWEDSEQGGDFDQDALGTLEYFVNAADKTISVRTFFAVESTGGPQGFGYAITGTDGKDGPHFHSGMDGFNYNDPRNISVTPTTNVNASGGCNNCQVNAASVPTTALYKMAGVPAESLKDPLWYAAKYGGFNTDVASAYTLGAVLPVAAFDAKNASGTAVADGVPDNYFLAVDPSQLEKSLDQIFLSVFKSGGSAPAVSPIRTSSGGFAYQSSYSINSDVTLPDTVASGQLQRYSFQANGNLGVAPDWDAGTNLSTQNWDTGRRILTQSSAGAIPFRWASLDAAQQRSLQTNSASGVLDAAVIGQNRLEWIRGNSANETPTGNLRVRAGTKLGAIVNSTPWFLTRPTAGYSDAAYGGGYSSFRSDNTATNAVFVAANDGMLHSFNAATGDEYFAYVPKAMFTTTTLAPFSKLSALTSKKFALNAGTDSVNVDGNVMIADMKVGSPAAWGSYLFGTFGRGAKGVYALNVTSPQTINEGATSLAKVVKWEYNEGVGDPDLGYITGRPSARPNGQPFQTGYMANGKWAAIFGNGYNSASGKAALYILFADGPPTGSNAWVANTHFVKIPVGSAGAGPDNGLATPTGIDSDNSGAIDTIYAGDLKGNVWKFDVSSPNPANWKVATTGSVPLYQAKTVLTGSTTVVVQPITTIVQPFPHPSGGFQLVFATGKALESNDYPMSAPYGNSIYGIYDKPGNTGSLTVGTAELVRKSTTFANGIRYIQNNTVDYTTQKGWYINLPQSSEGVPFNLLVDDINRAFVKSIAPDGEFDGCRIDSVGYDMTLDVISGAGFKGAVFGAPAISGFVAAGNQSTNSFEPARGGVFSIPPLPPSKTPCAAEGPSCTCNPGAASQCVVCTDYMSCNPPWDQVENNTACTPGSANCVTNPNDPNESVICPILLACNPPWKRAQIAASAGQCAYIQPAATTNGTASNVVRYGSCGEGRLTWREVIRNR